jgi:hypothetical protein
MLTHHSAVIPFRVARLRASVSPPYSDRPLLLSVYQLATIQSQYQRIGRTVGVARYADNGLHWVEFVI